MSKRNTSNDRTHTFSDEALIKLDKVPRMERSKFVDKAVLHYPLEGVDYTEEQKEWVAEAMKIKCKLDTGKAKLIESDTIFTPEQEQRIKEIIKEMMGK